MNPMREGQLIEANSHNAMTPVQCFDCGAQVPLGWVIFGTVKCPKNVGANGVQYGHRVQREVSEALFEKFAAAEEANA